MDIKNISAGINSYQSNSITKDTQAKTKNKAGTNSSSADTISLSSTAKLMQVSTEAAQQSSGTRPEKIQELKEQVTSGEYTPQSREIAQGIMKDTLDIWS